MLWGKATPQRRYEVPWDVVEVTRAQGGMMQVWGGHKHGVTRHGEATSGWGAPSHAPGDGATGAGISTPSPVVTWLTSSIFSFKPSGSSLIVIKLQGKRGQGRQEELDSIVFMGPFQLRIICDSVTGGLRACCLLAGRSNTAQGHPQAALGKTEAFST